MCPCRLFTEEPQTRIHSPKEGLSSNGMAYDLGLADRIRVVLGRSGAFSERKMFGGLCFLVNGHMCCGIVKSDLMLRLTQETATAAHREPNTRPMDFTGKPMKSMIYVGAEGVDSDSSLERWVRSSERMARALPGKAEKSRVPPRKTRKAAGLLGRRG
jgi:TfoX/Sxy family transcriptional regulator of competence genes